MRVVQLPSHAGALAALPGEHPRRTAVEDRTGDDAGVRGAVGKGGGAGAQDAGVGAEDDGAVVEAGTAGDEGQAGVGGVGVVRVTGEAGGLGGQGVVAAGRQHPGYDRWHGQGARCGFDGGRGLLDDHVGVGAADAERGDAGPAGAFAARPGAGSVSRRTAPGGPVDVRSGSSDVQGARAVVRAAAPGRS